MILSHEDSDHHDKKSYRNDRTTVTLWQCMAWSGTETGSLSQQR